MNEHEYKHTHIHTHAHAHTLNNTYTAVGTSTLLAFSYKATKLRLAHESISLFLFALQPFLVLVFLRRTTERTTEQPNTSNCYTNGNIFIYFCFSLSVSLSLFLFRFLCVGFYSAQYILLCMQHQIIFGRKFAVADDSVQVKPSANRY